MGLGRGLKITAWALLVLTSLSTIYFGWHYLLDDVGGLVIGVMALAMARALTGFDPHGPPAPRTTPDDRVTARTRRSPGAARVAPARWSRSVTFAAR